MLMSELICQQELTTRTSKLPSVLINPFVVPVQTIKILTLLWFGIILSSPTAILSAKEVPVFEVNGIVGESVRLPCDTSVSEERITQQEDNVVLILWYREDLGIPIYSIDVRGKDFDKAEKWSDDSVLNKRADFKCNSKWSNLVIDRITEKDEAMYRCRVDFKYAQTRNSKVNLTIIVPPQKVVILDEWNRAKSTVAGPYQEKANISFVCQVYGGKPYPSIKWLKDGHLINNTVTNVTHARDGNSMVTSVLVIRNLARTDLHSQLTCEGSNISNKSVTAIVEIDMNFSPLDVRIVAEEQPLTAQRKYDLVCESTGSRPPAKLTWWKNGDRLERTKDQISSDGNTTTSILTFVPSKDDKGKYLKCRAENPVVTDGIIRETKWNLEIHYTPETKIVLGTSLKPDAIKEGMDVYFDCVINAYPHVYKVEWRKNKKPLQANIQKGVIVSNQSLVLQSVVRSSAGNYSCIGYNEEGDGASDPFYLNVMYAPFCKANQTRVYGIAKNEVTNITCEVEANPFDLIFEWRFNNSAAAAAAAAAATTASVSMDGGEYVPSVLVNNSLGRVMSVVSHMPVQEIDYGTLVCLATNKVGRQRVPCVFHIITAGKPDAVTNCTHYNVSSYSFSIRCVEGFNGGLPQTFHLLVNEDDENYGEQFYGEKHSINISNAISPLFAATGLKSGTSYSVSVYSSNTKGSSEPYRLQIVTAGKRVAPVADIRADRNGDVRNIFNGELATTTEKRRSSFYAFYTSRWWTISTIAIATVIILSLLVICIIIVAFKRRQSGKSSTDCDKSEQRRYQSQRSRPKMSISNGDLQIFETDKNYSSPARVNCRQGDAIAVCEPVINCIAEADDNNPDIIPQPVADLDEYLVTKQHISTIENRYLFNENFLKHNAANSPIGFSGYCTLRTGVPLRDLRRNVNAATIRPGCEEAQQQQSLSTSCTNLMRNYQWPPPLVYTDSLIDPNYQHIQYQQMPPLQKPLPCTNVTHRLTQTQTQTPDDIISENSPLQTSSPTVSKQESTV